MPLGHAQQEHVWQPLCCGAPLSDFLVVTVGVLCFMGWVLNQKAKGEPEAIFPMWLAFFVAFFASTGVLGWAGNAGMFGFDGVPRNPVAQVIVRGAEWFLAVNDESALLLGILAMFVLSQWCAYLAAGASGAARRSRFVVFAWKWVALFIAKAFISASAVLLGIVLVGSYYAWLNPEPLNVCANAMTALLLLIPGVAIFCTVPLKKAEGRTVSRRVRRIHKWTRLCSTALAAPALRHVATLHGGLSRSRRRRRAPLPGAYPQAHW
ncbi:hypothetical protein AB4Y32_32450 [Paraburkholderia phymatum]|uniref:Uncharacterized protein n=1 Tax=Paraburkholderia phymatum TaxID=148447 RepID=A0ACC6UAB4_9BURK